MELCVDLKEITRIPYHELETVYFSVSFTVLPNGERFITGPSYGDKFIKFRPHRFKFIVDDVKNTHFSLTIFSHLTDKRSFILSCLKIPLIFVPINGFATKLFETILFRPISISPIVKLTIGLNINYSIEKTLEHPSIIDKIEYDKYESAPILQLDCFGKLSPPKQYLDKCSKLVEKNLGLFKKLITNDALRKYVLDKASEYYENTEDISSLFENEPKKKKDIISNQKYEFSIIIEDELGFYKRDSSSEIKNLKKDSEIVLNSNSSKFKTGRSPQPPNEPKSKCFRGEDQKADNSLNSDNLNQFEDEILAKSSISSNIGSSTKVQSKSFNIKAISKNDSESPPQSYHPIESSSFITQKLQFQQFPQPQQTKQLSQQSKVQMPPQPQTQKIQSQPSQQSFPKKLPIQLPNQLQQQQSHTPQPQSSYRQIQPFSSNAENGMQKKIVKGILQKINTDNDKSQAKRGILIAKQVHKIISSKTDDNDNDFADRRSSKAAKKPKPPTQIQLPNASLQPQVDNNNPRFR